MSLDTFRTILEQVDWKVKMFNFDFAGEPLINPHIFKMISLAREKNIPSCIDTNGVLLNRHIEEIVDSGLKFLNIAVEGIDNQTHQQYRVGARLDEILDGLKNICARKKQLNSATPLVSLQIIVMKHNEDQIDELIKLAQDIGAERVILKSLNLNLGLSLNNKPEAALAERFLPTNPRYLRYASTGQRNIFNPRLNSLCSFPLNSMVILWNGDVILCCLDFNGRHVVGNIKIRPLKQLWAGREYNHYRNLIFNRRLDICTNCNFSETRNETIYIKQSDKKN
jgi:radical SAM protein with 4Fe4S-binding SPASM domain